MTQSRAPFYFVLPDDHHLPSGGNIYNEKLISALQALKVPVVSMCFEQYRQQAPHIPEGIFLIDSLFVDTLRAWMPERMPGLLSVFMMHHLSSLDPPEDSSAELIFEKNERPVLAGFDAFLVSSQFSADYLQQKGLEQPKIVVEPASERTEHNESPVVPPLRALMVANVVARKGILPLLQALKDLSLPEDDFLLEIVGRTEMEADYYRQCLEYTRQPPLAGKVRFSGPLPYEETLRRYTAHHLFISAARMETYGMAIQEARVHALPLLLIRGGHASRHLSEGAGHLFDDPTALAGFFLNLVRSPHEFIKLKHAALGSRSALAHYDWHKAAQHFLTQFTTFYPKAHVH
jgi:glycosyltransferase involved in cell wall biosynthesis